ncbi:MAG: hypothetical protein HY201_03390, partial [Nitrospirae bacterium]|nr:hypothetical protein [Candidatus Troglogloeales bacterium]
GTGTAQTAESPASAPPSSGTGTAQTAESPASAPPSSGTGTAQTAGSPASAPPSSGTGTAQTAGSPASAPPSSELTSERMVSLDFDNVDLPVMVKFISELTGKNFVIDEQVRGRVTIFSPTKISTSKAYDVSGCPRRAADAPEVQQFG